MHRASLFLSRGALPHGKDQCKELYALLRHETSRHPRDRFRVGASRLADDRGAGWQGRLPSVRRFERERSVAGLAPPVDAEGWRRFHFAPRNVRPGSAVRRGNRDVPSPPSGFSWEVSTPPTCTLGRLLEEVRVQRASRRRLARRVGFLSWAPQISLPSALTVSLLRDFDRRSMPSFFGP